VPRESSTSDSEENSAVKDCDQQSVGDTDNQVCTFLFNLSKMKHIFQRLTNN
jgi:hypothetical protein